MIDIETLLEENEKYSQNIGEYVNHLREAGVNTFEEFKAAASKAGIPVRKTIQDMLADAFNNSQSKDDEAWSEACEKNTQEAYLSYLGSNPEGQHRDEAREAIEALNTAVPPVNHGESSVDPWASVDKTSYKALKDYIEKYPVSTHIEEANRFLQWLELTRPTFNTLTDDIRNILNKKEVANPDRAIYELIAEYLKKEYITIDELIAAISENNNYLKAAVIKNLIEAGHISPIDVSKMNIDYEFIKYMLTPNSNRVDVRFEKPHAIDRVTKVPSTEVYFWGIPSSGKTCTIGAILSCANSGRVAKSMQMDNNCQGYNYMNTLAEMFKANGEVMSLPEGTPVFSIYEMGLTLQDNKDKFHPLTFIDLAGELIECMYRFDAGQTLTNDQAGALSTVTQILHDNRTQNRKLHFFVIEYGAEDRLYKGFRQSTYLNAAVNYIERTKIFKKDTDGIYILFTKSDRAKVNDSELMGVLVEHLEKEYLAFFQGLKRICKHNEINDGRVEVMPFTLGEVVFQDYCRCNDETATLVVEEILSKSFGLKAGKMAKIQNNLSK